MTTTTKQILNRNIHQVAPKKERIMQFGEGNFLRAFADQMIHHMYRQVDFDGGVVVVQPIQHGMVDVLNEQEGLYTTYLNGIKNGQAVSEKHVVDCIQRGVNPYDDYQEFIDLAINPDLRFVISNTTEAGIAYDPTNKLDDEPPASFPGKVTQLLKKRYDTFYGDSDGGLIFLPCELIDRNGDNLKRIVLQYASEWQLSEDFVKWVNEACIFTNTLVDRIVPGYPKAKIDEIHEELGYHDKLVVEGEQFHLWVIEGPENVRQEFPANAAGLNVVFTDNMEPYRTRKVRILNGAHTTMVPVAYLYGIDHVRESVKDMVMGTFIREAIFEEICPTLDLPTTELATFAHDVIDRFRNPYLQHALISISLNSISKFKTRVLPSLLEFVNRKGELPKRLCFSLAALLAFYRGERNGERIPLNDSPEVLAFFNKLWNDSDEEAKLTMRFLANEDFWGEDLNEIEGLTNLVAGYYSSIRKTGVTKELIQSI